MKNSESIKERKDFQLREETVKCRKLTDILITTNTLFAYPMRFTVHKKASKPHVLRERFEFTNLKDALHGCGIIASGCFYAVRKKNLNKRRHDAEIN